MQAFQKQAEAHLAKAGTGLVVSTLPTIITHGYWISPMAMCTKAARAPIAIMFVVLGLLTSAA